jgi:hypothetical protein
LQITSSWPILALLQLLTGAARFVTVADYKQLAYISFVAAFFQYC